VKEDGIEFPTCFQLDDISNTYNADQVNQILKQTHFTDLLQGFFQHGNFRLKLVSDEEGGENGT
jgi:hypothetical protein